MLVEVLNNVKESNKNDARHGYGLTWKDLACSSDEGSLDEDDNDDDQVCLCVNGAGVHATDSNRLKSIPRAIKTLS